MKKIVLFGAGKSATVLIDYLLENSKKEEWQLTVVDANIELAKSKIRNSPNGIAVSFDINNSEERKKYIGEAGIVISLLPPASSLHCCKRMCRIEKKSFDRLLC